MDKHAIGKKRIQEIIGGDAESIFHTLETVSSDYAKYAVDFSY